MARVTRTTPLEGLNLRWPLGLALAAQARAADAPEVLGARVLGFTPPASRDVRAGDLRINTVRQKLAQAHRSIFAAGS